MKTPFFLCALFLLSTGCAFQLGAQGPLTPPGPPGPTMKTLQQVEPRIDLATLSGDATDVVVISSPGSYYLSANITGTAGKNGILINADNVTIDLNGFEVLGTTSGANALSGILDSVGHKNLSISNGTVSGWGLGNISLISSSYVELRRLRLSNATGNGTFATGDGFNGRNCTGSLIVDCVASGNAGDGFACGLNCTMTGCVSNHNALSGCSGTNLGCTNCSADSNASAGFFLFSGGRLNNCAATGVRAQATQGDGFLTGSGSVVTACIAIGNSDAGFDTASSVVTGCVAQDNNIGFFFTSNDILSNNLATANATHGFQGSGSNNRIDGNSAISNTGTGFLSASTTADFSFRNTAFANGTDYNPVAGTYTGPHQVPSTATSPWANF